MPANKKHLTKSPIERFLKVSAGFAGGYLVTESLHMALALWTHLGNMIYTLRYAGFILWASLFIVALISKKGWKVWVIYLVLFCVFSALVHYGKLIHPIQ